MQFYSRLQSLGEGPKNADEEKPPQGNVFAEGNVAQIISTPPSTATLIEKQNPPELKGKLGYFPIPARPPRRPARCSPAAPT